MDSELESSNFAVPAELCDGEDFNFYPFASATLQTDVSLLNNDFFDVIENFYADDINEFDFGYPTVALPIASVSAENVCLTSTAENNQVMTYETIPVDLNFKTEQDQGFLEDEIARKIAADREINSASVLPQIRNIDCCLAESIVVSVPQSMLEKTNSVLNTCSSLTYDQKKQHRTQAIIRWLSKRRKRMQRDKFLLSSNTVSSDSLSTSSACASLSAAHISQPPLSSLSLNIPVRLEPNPRQVAAARREREHGKFKRLKATWVRLLDFQAQSDASYNRESGTDHQIHKMSATSRL
jgi:hypothetical protein